MVRDLLSGSFSLLRPMDATPYDTFFSTLVCASATMTILVLKEVASKLGNLIPYIIKLSSYRPATLGGSNNEFTSSGFEINGRT